MWANLAGVARSGVLRVCKVDAKGKPTGSYANIASGQRAETPSKAKGGKQGLWLEAAGPDGRGIGFKKERIRRQHKTGLQGWKSLVGLTTPKSAKKVSAASDGLKAMLGVGSPAPAKAPAKAPFPRKDSGKLIFPQNEFQLLSF